jgi:hypothetical protein
MAVMSQKLLPKIIIAFSKSRLLRNPFDCVATPAVRSMRWALERIFAMLEAVTALFGFISAGIFLAHAVDGYRSARG